MENRFHLSCTRRWTTSGSAGGPIGPAEVVRDEWRPVDLHPSGVWPVQRVCRVWHRARSSVYARRQADTVSCTGVVAAGRSARPRTTSWPAHIRPGARSLAVSWRGLPKSLGEAAGRGDAHDRRSLRAPQLMREQRPPSPAARGPRAWAEGAATGDHRRRQTRGALPGRGCGAQTMTATVTGLAERRRRPSFFDGHNAAIHYFGGVPHRIGLHDNAKLAVARLLGDGTCQRTRVFSELQSHTCSTNASGGIGEGQRQRQGGRAGRLRAPELLRAGPTLRQLGRVEPRLGEQVPRACGRRLRRHTETIGERFARDRQALLPLPPVPYDAFDQRSTRAHVAGAGARPPQRLLGADRLRSTSSGCWRSTTWTEVVIVCGSEAIARPSSQL